jgi:2-polyprenyl-3-methyl-5-hydroxy-6-metoxy-1,4-benzoquinol methylase
VEARYFENERADVAQFVPAEGARILDVGCGAGALGRLLKERGAREVIGIEEHAGAAALARERLDRVLELDLDRVDALPLEEGSFDCVVCADVLEHLRDPERALMLLRRYVKPDGRLVASIPNVRHANALVPLLLDGRWKYEDAGILDRTHLRFFTTTEVGALLRRTGFAIELAEGTVTPEHPAIPIIAEAVARLGGDAERFRKESRVVQVVVRATPVA